MISFDELNYFIDNQLLREERIKILGELNKDDDLSKTLSELQRNDEFVVMSYSDIPEPRNNPYVAATTKTKKNFYAIAASMLIFFSVILGWQTSHFISINNKPKIMNLSQLDNNASQYDNVLIHINDMDDTRIQNVFEKIENLVKSNKKVNIDIIANEEGLSLLRKNSPYASKIKLLANKYSNVKFKACGIAMNIAKLKEGKKIILLPQAEKIPAALDAILQHLKDNWVYFKA